MHNGTANKGAPKPAKALRMAGAQAALAALVLGLGLGGTFCAARY